MDLFTNVLSIFLPSYCRLCLVRLPSSARKDRSLDKVIQIVSSKYEQIPLVDIRRSGERGCRVCQGIFEGLRQKCAGREHLAGITWQDWSQWFSFEVKKDKKDIVYPDNPVAYSADFRLFYDCDTPTPADPKSISPFVIKNPNPASLVDAKSYVRAIKILMDDCARRHKECIPRPIPHDAPLPARMLRITDSGGAHPSVQLVEFPTREDYICLSHCWGQVRPECITTQASYSRNKAGIPWRTIPRTFQDAITITHLLGKQYLWIDSMCIIQGDEADWRSEASKMCSIYENAALTLMATRAANAHDGLLPPPLALFTHEIPTPGLPGRLVLAQQTHEHLERVPARPQSYHGTRFPLLHRAWVFQERCLSLRVAHFTAEGVVYECPGGFEPGIPGKEYESFNPPPLKLGRGLWTAPRNRAEFAGLWNQLVEMYSGLELTFGKDSLPAMAGLAKQMAVKSRERGYDPGRYLAGLWEDTFADSLIWGGRTRVYRGKGWIAPSWSWALANGAVDVKWRYNDLDLVDFDVALKGPDEFGEISSLRVRVATRLIEMKTADKEANGLSENNLPMPSGGWLTLKGIPKKMKLPKTVFCVLSQYGGALLVLVPVAGAPNTYKRFCCVPDVWNAAREQLLEMEKKQPKVEFELV
ncbi:heterokaryon incompatibility protein-domain-containing protein [Echria macrotheca]|uniref:Heterokaryon incompatibility protein-domain-containing protein n=1 Tax=Echria macrotheca TaxID=438768 RepID=A0AAJ0F3N7_9PEZI|nr:heterokaryon incompatibility protein-domain-containing protein [Echria macrotheca]